MLYLATTVETALGRILRGHRFLDLADVTVSGFDHALDSQLRENRRVAILRVEKDHPLIQELCKIALFLGLPAPDVVEEANLPPFSDVHFLVLHQENGILGAYYIVPDPLPNGGGK